MIKDDYVNFETAKLLREKGFNEDTYTSIKVFAGHNYEVNGEWITPSSDTIIPTLQMAMKWLREEKNLCIEPYRTACGYLSTISKVPTGSELYSQEYEGDDENSGQFTTYEKSCEAAIKYCLEKLLN